jgi:hypothetical protein
MSRHILDENAPDDQYPLIQQWLSIVKVGDGWGQTGMKDDEIRSHLNRERNVTFHTQDVDLYHPSWRHPNYGVVYYDVAPDDLAEYLRRFLRHPQFRTHAQRRGKVVRVTAQGISVWEWGHDHVQYFEWAGR